MEGAYYEVAGDGRLNGDAGGLAVSDLTDHDDVRVLSQNGTKRGCERKTCFRIDVYLVDTVDVGLDRVLNGDDIHFFSVQLRKSRIQCGGLTGTGGSGYEDDSVRVR